MKSSSLLFLSSLIILSSLICPCCEGYSIAAGSVRVSGDPLKSIFRELPIWDHWAMQTLAMHKPQALVTLVLAGNRTKRPDILRRFKRYQGGWDVRNKHYWASIGFTGAPGFILAVLWFISFGTAALVNEFYSEALHTVSYVVNQSGYTVQMLRNVREYLSLAKSINLSRVILPSDIQEDIDELKVDLTSTAQTLTVKTSDNAAIIRRVFNIVVDSHVHCVSSLLQESILNRCYSSNASRSACWPRAVLDSCTAMQEWANNPQAETALGDILPCVDERYTNQTLNESKKVVAGIANVFNQFIYTMQTLIGPEVWEKYICKPSKHHDICRTVGRLTPSMYSQLVDAVNASYAIKHYTPPMLSLENCNITSSYCPPLEHYLGLVVAGLALISVGVMLCLILWILNANLPQREEVFVKFSSPVVCKSRDAPGDFAITLREHLAEFFALYELDG
ncbi:hypothetical protein AKJ16_DCAP13445 [Drosera capensis]